MKFRVVLAVSLIASTGAPALPALAGSPGCTIEGTRHADVLTGGSSDDVICGFGGSDLILGRLGNDTLRGGGGADTLVGGEGDDVLDGGAGADAVSYARSEAAVAASLDSGVATGEGSDTLIGAEAVIGSANPDRIEGSSAGDRLIGGDGRDQIEGLGGDDTLIGGEGVNSLSAGPGVDSCVQQRGTTASCERHWLPVVFARARGLELYEPAADPVAITYHESLFGSAVPLRPLGHLIVNANPGKFTAPPTTPGPGYIVMDSRGRPTPATSASDEVLRSRTKVLSPVTGVVESVTEYSLYCVTPDIRVVIRPDDAPEMTVLLLHLKNIRVAEGDRVVYSDTVIGIPRGFSWRDQTDGYVAGGHPHMHVEVERDGSSPLPGCRYSGRAARSIWTE